MEGMQIIIVAYWEWRSIVKKFVNILNENDLADLNKDMERIAQSRRDRKLRESFTSYLEFLESSAAAFGLGKEIQREKFSLAGPDLLL